MSQVSLGRLEFVPGTPPGHPTAKFLYVIFLSRCFFLSLFEQSLKVSQQVGPEVGSPVEVKRKTRLFELFFETP